MNGYLREPINTITHLIGAVLALGGMIAMIFKASLGNSSTTSLIAVIIFGISMIALYATSATYHMVKAKDEVILFLRRLDHSMIFVLIAGSYTPFCLVAMNGLEGWLLFGIVMSVAILGIIFKMVWFSCPRWLSTFIYIALGWLAVFFIVPLRETMSTEGISFLIAGGIVYTLGGVIYALKPKFLQFKNWGFHEIFHLFIMLGSLLHFIAVYFYVI